MIDRLSPVARRIAFAVLFCLLVWFCWTVRTVLNPLILGYLVAFVLHPLVLKLERRGWKRRSSVNLIFGGVAIAFTLVGVLAFFQARSFAREFTAADGIGHKVRMRIDQALEDYKEEIQWAVALIPTEGDEGAAAPGSTTPVDPNAPAQPAEQNLHSEDLQRWVRGWWSDWVSDERTAQLGDVGLQAAGGALVFLRRMFGGVLEFLGLAILLPIYTYFLLFELERIHGFVQRYLPHRERARIVRIGSQIGEVLANFFRGRLLVCLAKGAFLTIGLFLAGVDYALILGMGTGVLSLIPFVGSLAGFVLALAVGMVEHSALSALLRVGSVFAAAEALENYVLLPKILGDSLGLHPVVVIFAIMAGGASLGMFGLLIALPLAASLVILARELVLPSLAELADRDERAII